MIGFALIPAALCAWEIWTGWRQWRAGRSAEAHESWRIAFLAAALTVGLAAVAVDLEAIPPLELPSHTRVDP